MSTNHENMDRYADIIHLPHHTSDKHPRMSQHDRAAQFSPFAALTGYHAVIAEAARYTDKYTEADEDTKAKINARLQILMERASEKPAVSITYFKPDEKKDGGAYVTRSGNVKRVDAYARLVIMTDGTEIPIHFLYAIEGDLF